MNYCRAAKRIEAEVRCLHCTRPVGRLSQGTPGGPLELHDLGGGAALAVRDIAELRCGHCRGPLYADEFETRYIEPKLDLGDERRRRGRPGRRGGWATDFGPAVEGRGWRELLTR